jgi:hypothetical protein
MADGAVAGITLPPVLAAGPGQEARAVARGRRTGNPSGTWSPWNGGASNIEQINSQLQSQVAPLGSDWAGVAQARFHELWAEWPFLARHPGGAHWDLPS